MIIREAVVELIDRRPSEAAPKNSLIAPVIRMYRDLAIYFRNVSAENVRMSMKHNVEDVSLLLWADMQTIVERDAVHRSA